MKTNNVNKWNEVSNLKWSNLFWKKINNNGWNTLEKDNLPWVDDYLNLLHLEKSWKYLLSAWTNLLTGSLVLNQKLLKSIQEFQKLGSWLTEIEKNALKKTLKNYQKNLELQKEFMNSWLSRQKCVTKVYNTKPKQETTRPKQKTTKPKQETTKPKQKTTKPKQETTKLKQENTKPKQETTKLKQETTKLKQETTKPKQYNSISR